MPMQFILMYHFCCLQIVSHRRNNPNPKKVVSSKLLLKLQTMMINQYFNKKKIGTEQDLFGANFFFMISINLSSSILG